MADNAPELTSTVLVSSGDLKTEIGKLLVVARRSLRKPPDQLTEGDTVVWMFALADIAVDDIMPALVSYMRSNTFFPSPAQIIEHAGMIAQKRENNARAARDREMRRMRELEQQVENERRAALTPAERKKEDDDARRRLQAIKTRYAWLLADDAQIPVKPVSNAAQVNLDGEKHDFRTGTDDDGE